MAFAGPYNKFARSVLGGAAVVFASGVPLVVGQLTINNTDAATAEVTVTDNAAAPVTVMTISIPPGDTFVSSVPLLFDKGFRVGTGAATTKVTIFYREI
jgi:hypothetical protein